MQIYIMQNALWLSLWKILISEKVALWFFILQFPTGTPGRFLREGGKGSNAERSSIADGGFCAALSTSTDKLYALIGHPGMKMLV